MSEMTHEQREAALTELRAIAKTLGMMAEPLLDAAPHNGQARRRERDDLIANLRRAEGRVLNVMQDMRAALASAPAPPADAQERLDNATAQLLIELAFLAPAGTDLMRDTDLSAKLKEFQRASLAAFAPAPPVGTPPAEMPTIEVGDTIVHGRPKEPLQFMYCITDYEKRGWQDDPNVVAVLRAIWRRPAAPEDQ